MADITVQTTDRGYVIVTVVDEAIGIQMQIPMTSYAAQEIGENLLKAASIAGRFACPMQLMRMP